MLAENIRTLRESFGLSQRDFAKELGVSYGVIANLEYGKLQNPERKMPLFQLMSEKFGVPLEWILADDPGPVPLPELDEAQQEAAQLGKLLASDDPVIAGFLDFYARRTPAERAQICKYVLDFADSIKQHQK